MHSSDDMICIWWWVNQVMRGANCYQNLFAFSIFNTLVTHTPDWFKILHSILVGCTQKHANLTVLQIFTLAKMLNSNRLRGKNKPTKVLFAPRAEQGEDTTGGGKKAMPCWQTPAPHVKKGAHKFARKKRWESTYDGYKLQPGEIIAIPYTAALLSSLFRKTQFGRSCGEIWSGRL